MLRKAILELMARTQPSHFSGTDILVEYKRSDLRFSSDRLPAIKGIIQEIEDRWNNVLGMWQPFLLHELMWTHFPREQYQPRIPGIPTWPWISMAWQPIYMLAGFFSVRAQIEGMETTSQSYAIDEREGKMALRIKSTISP